MTTPRKSSAGGTGDRYPGPPKGPLSLPHPNHQGRQAIEGDTRPCAKSHGKQKPLAEFTPYDDGTYRASCDRCEWITQQGSMVAPSRKRSKADEDEKGGGGVGKEKKAGTDFGKGQGGGSEQTV